MISNPFDINKAVDYTDQQLFDYWVNIGEDSGFDKMMKPSTLMPMIIVGSKGSGKTHIMKYYSYELQKIRLSSDKAPQSLAEKFQKESFIGIYVRCSGLNADTFTGKGVSDDVWQGIFDYYWELWLGERVLSTIIDLQKQSIINDFSEQILVNNILSLFLGEHAECQALQELKDYFIHLQKQLLFEVHNFLFQGKQLPNVEIKLNVSSITYGIPSILQATVPYFKDRHILYLIDEYENFSESQQQLIQSLLREKPTACTIRIGTRPYGIRTYYTLGRIEENISGSEFEELRLDDWIRNSDNYKEYIKKICISRLQGSNLSCRESDKIEDLIEVITPTNIEEQASKRKSYGNLFVNLRKNLKAYRHQKLTDDEIEAVVQCVTFAPNLIIERSCVALLYKQLKAKTTSVLEDAKAIREQAVKYVNGEKETDIAGYLSYYRHDMIDSIARLANIRIPYYGLDTLIELSCGTPRTILRLLKHAFSRQYFNTGKAPFEKGQVLKAEAQQIGIDNTNAWFFEENRVPGDIIGVKDVVKRLGNFLQSLRFSDLPPQCSINIFSVPDGLSEEAQTTINTLVLYSYLIDQDERRRKNSDNKAHVYRLNSILLPKWELSLEKRGNVELTKEDAEVIFNPSRCEEYDKHIKNKLTAYNFPFTAKADDKAVGEELFLF